MLNLKLKFLLGGKGISNFGVDEKIVKGIEVKIMKKGFLIPQCGTRLRTLYFFSVLKIQWCNSIAKKQILPVTIANKAKIIALLRKNV